MADKKATLWIELKDAVSTGLTSMAAKLAILRQGWLAVTSVVQPFISALGGMLAAYGEQEDAVAKLTNALKNQGITSRLAVEDLQEYATELQRTAGVGDEVAMDAMALGTTFGLVGESLKATTKAAVDMSAAMNIDLKTTMLLLGKAAVGETSTLSRYGVIISESIPKAQRFEEALRQLNSRFGGAAEKQAQTYAGRVKALSFQFGDLKENLGSLLVGPATELISWATRATEKMNELFSTTQLAVIRARVKELEKEKESLYVTAATYDRYAASQSAQGAKTTEDIATIEKKISALKKEEEQLKKNAWAGVKGFVAPKEEDEAKKKKIEDDMAARYEADIRLMDQANLTQEELAEIDVVWKAQELERLGKHEAAQDLIRSHRLAKEKEFNAQRAANFKSTMGFISTLASSENKSLAAIGKAAAITQATMDTYAAANVALRSAPPPFNFGLAALVTAAGMANVAKISGMKLGEGGMVMPRSGGTLATIAEVGKPEVAIPLDDERTKEKLRDTLGGGGNTVIIQAGVVVADDYSLGEFAQKLDEKLFELQRNGRSYR